MLRLMGVPVKAAHVYDDATGRVRLVSDDNGETGVTQLRADEYRAGWKQFDKDVLRPIGCADGEVRYAAWVLLFATQYAAGLVAEQLLHGVDSRTPDGELGWSRLTLGDEELMVSALTGTFGDDAARFWCQRSARHHLSRHWGWVTAVAAWLEERSVITGEMVDELKSPYLGLVGNG